MGAPNTVSLDQIRIDTPCPMRWDDMHGDGRVRHCSRCDLDVHNLSAMTRTAAESLLNAGGAHLCVTYAHAGDERPMTRPDRTPGWRTAHARLAWLVSGVLASVGFGALATGCSHRTGGKVCLPEEPASGAGASIPLGQLDPSELQSNTPDASVLGRVRMDR